MSIGLIGKKVGMTRIYDDLGNAIPVTVIDVRDNVFLQRKTVEKDGYSAVQVGYDDQKTSRINKAEAGHFKSNDVSPKRRVQEFRLSSDSELPEGDHPGLDVFVEGQWVDVIGTSKGKGFQGAMRRHNFAGQPQTHGHMMHRRTGAVAAGSTPARIWKGKRMPGHQGCDSITVQNLKIVKKRSEDGVILVSGAVPGSKGSYVVIRPAVKKPAPAIEEASGEN